MTGLRLSATLGVVGPRAGLMTRPFWPMALRIAIGLADPVDPVDPATAIESTLPWLVWPDAKLPSIVLTRADGGEIGRYDAMAPLFEDPDFLAAAKAMIRARGERLAQDSALALDFLFEGQPVDVHDDPAHQHISWPGLLATLSTLAAPTASALKATWYFLVPRDDLVRLDAHEVPYLIEPSISAAPSVVRGATYAPREQQPPANGQLKSHFYIGEDVQAHAEMLDLVSASDAGLDELDNYWLAIRDSRDDSLLDLASRVLQALDPVSIVGALALDEIAGACVTGNPARPLTLAEARDVQAALRGAAEKAHDLRAAWRDAVLDEALASVADPVGALRTAYLHKLADALGMLLDMANAHAGWSASLPELVSALRERLLPAFRASDPGPCAPGEGIALAIGDERLRLLHLDRVDTDTASAAVDEVASIQLFGRRATKPEALDLAPDAGGAEWHALSAGHLVVAGADGKEVASTDRIFGVTATYVDKVLCREMQYLGANLVCRNPMERVHREQIDPEHGDSDKLVLLPRDRRASSEWAMRALPLRYGDTYEFAASVVDRSGGLAVQLCVSPDAPWSFEPRSIDTLSPPQRDRVQFLRRVAVGSCNVLPPPGGWPVVPDEVWLRCVEEDMLHAPEHMPRPPTTLLVPAGDPGFAARQIGDATVAWPSEIEFSVERPRIDEHTLQRWMIPPTDIAPADQRRTLAVLVDTLAGIHKARDGLITTGRGESAGGLPYDPAVTAIGLRYTYDDGKKGQLVIDSPLQSIRVRHAPTNLPDKAPTFDLAPGRHLKLEFAALVRADDFDRFDAQALASLLEEPASPWTSHGVAYRAFQPSTVLVECADSALTKIEPEHLNLDVDVAGDVELRIAFSKLDAPDLLRNLHQLRFFSQRWIWRNLPNVAPDTLAGIAAPEERRRLLASGPPAEIIVPVQRDDPASRLVLQYDPVAELDTGFVDRPEVVVRYPRQAQDSTSLLVDTREGLASADYLRYRVMPESRYRGVLVQKKRPQTAVRRVAAPFRGSPDRIKPPRVLAVLPLLQRLQVPGIDAKVPGASFLVVLDEPWFREYGIGERLAARVAHVKAEIGETMVPPEMRFGPLPDHSVTPQAALADRIAKDPALDVFGPFGFTLDRGDNQAAANATGFVVHAPPNTPPHYNLFVEFLRLLDLPTSPGSPLTSAATEALPLYTLPDSSALTPSDGRLHVTRSGSAWRYPASSLQTLPFDGAAGEVLAQYRYALVLGRKVLDGGRGVEVFLPQEALWMDNGTLNPLVANLDVSACDTGVVLEILLNGRRGPGYVDPLDAAVGLGSLFRILFDNRGDAPGMIRRITAMFDVSMS